MTAQGHRIQHQPAPYDLCRRQPFSASLMNRNLEPRAHAGSTNCATTFTRELQGPLPGPRGRAHFLDPTQRPPPNGPNSPQLAKASWKSAGLLRGNRRHRGLHNPHVVLRGHHYGPVQPPRVERDFLVRREEIRVRDHG